MCVLWIDAFECHKLCFVFLCVLVCCELLLCVYACVPCVLWTGGVGRNRGGRSNEPINQPTHTLNTHLTSHSDAQMKCLKMDETKTPSHHTHPHPQPHAHAHARTQVEVGGSKGKGVTAAVKQVHEDFQARVLACNEMLLYHSHFITTRGGGMEPSING